MPWLENAEKKTDVDVTSMKDLSSSDVRNNTAMKSFVSEAK